MTVIYPVYDKTSALILVMATNILVIRPLVSGICLLILPSFVPGCFRDWYMLAHPALLFPGCTRLACLNAAHLLRPKGTLGQKQGNHSFKSYKVARCPHAPSFPRAPRRPRASAGALCAGARAARARAAARAARAARARAARAANLRFKVVLYRP